MEFSSQFSAASISFNHLGKIMSVDASVSKEMGSPDLFISSLSTGVSVFLYLVKSAARDVGAAKHKLR